MYGNIAYIKYKVQEPFLFSRLKKSISIQTSHTSGWWVILNLNTLKAGFYITF